MTEIPLYIFLFIYILFLTVFVIFALINFYHLVMTASLTIVSFFVSFFVLMYTILALYATWWLLQDVNWQQSIISFSAISDLFSSKF